MKSKIKGFSIIELVIAVAIVALLAAVAIPTFSFLVGRANITADVQAVYNMNVVLHSKIAEGSAPLSHADMIAALRESGIADFRPQSEFHTFYWLRDKKIIVLANEDDIPVYPEEYSDEVFNLENWFDLEEAAGMPPVPTAPEALELPAEPETYTVTVRKSGTSSKIDFGLPSSATEGQPYRAEILIPEEMRMSHSIVKVTATMTDGETQHKFVVRSEQSTDTFFSSSEPAVLSIPCVTGPITVHVSVKEFCTVTITGDENMLRESVKIRCEKGILLLFGNNLFEKYLLKEGYRLASATATMNGRDLGDIFDESEHAIHNGKITIHSDVDIKITSEWKTYNVKLIIKHNGSEVAVDEKIISYPDNTCLFDLNAILGTDKYKVVHKYYYPTNIKEENMPYIVYNDTDGTLKVTDPKCDLTFYYFVEYTD